MTGHVPKLASLDLMPYGERAVAEGEGGRAQSAAPLGPCRGRRQR
jgi:hypothetical protein